MPSVVASRTYGAGWSRAWRDSLTMGSYIPGLGLTETGPLPDPAVGVLPGIARTRVDPSSGYAVSFAPGVYENLDIYGDLVFTGTGEYVFINCGMYGRRPTFGDGSYNGAAFNTNTARLIRFYDSTFDGWGWWKRDGSTHTVTRTTAGDTVQMKGLVTSLAVKGANIELHRCEVVNWQDAIFIVGDHWRVLGCWLHRNQYMNGGVGTSSDGNTHCDFVQFAWGNDVEIAYNMLGGVRIIDSYTPALPGDNLGEDASNAAFMIQLETAGQNITANIHDNWVGGGAATFNGFLKNGNYLAGVTIENNRVLRRGATVAANGYRSDAQKVDGSAGYYIIRPSSLQWTLTDNVVWDLTGSIYGTGTPVPITNG